MLTFPTVLAHVCPACGPEVPLKNAVLDVGEDKVLLGITRTGQAPKGPGVVAAASITLRGEWHMHVPPHFMKQAVWEPLATRSVVLVVWGCVCGGGGGYCCMTT